MRVDFSAGDGQLSSGERRGTGNREAQLGRPRPGDVCRRRRPAACNPRPADEAPRCLARARRGIPPRASPPRRRGHPGYRAPPPRLRSSPPLPRGRGADAAQARRVLADRDSSQHRLGPAHVGPRLTTRISALFGVVSPPLAMALVLVAGATTPGYAPVTRTVSRLAVPGMPKAWMVEVAIGLIAVSCFALAFGLHRSAIVRSALVVAGGGPLGGGPGGVCPRPRTAR